MARFFVYNMYSIVQLIKELTDKDMRHSALIPNDDRAPDSYYSLAINAVRLVYGNCEEGTQSIHPTM